MRHRAPRDQPTDQPSERASERKIDRATDTFVFHHQPSRSNQFGKQEPDDEGTIKAFVKRKYGVTFPMFSKVEVNGPGAHPVWQFLKSSQDLGTEEIGWNVSSLTPHASLFPSSTDPIAFPLPSSLGSFSSSWSTGRVTWSSATRSASSPSTWSRTSSTSSKSRPPLTEPRESGNGTMIGSSQSVF